MTTTTQNNITGTLTEYSAWGTNRNPNSPFNTTNCSPDLASTNIDLAKKRDIQHLFSRMTFGANLLDINWALTKTPSQVVDILVDLAVGETNVPAPGLGVHTWGDKGLLEDTELPIHSSNSLVWKGMRMRTLQNEWIAAMVGKNAPNDSITQQNIDRAKRFKYKMAFFWHNHFVADGKNLNQKTGVMWYKYTLIYNAVGNFKTFTKDIGLTQQMLVYLNAGENLYRQDPNWTPNENYARELLELFVMGVKTNDPNHSDYATDYQQSDIEELSKVSSGWRFVDSKETNPIFREFIFQPNLHDWSKKTYWNKYYIYR